MSFKWEIKQNADFTGYLKLIRNTIKPFYNQLTHGWTFIKPEDNIKWWIYLPRKKWLNSLHLTSTSWAVGAPQCVFTFALQIYVWAHYVHCWKKHIFSIKNACVNTENTWKNKNKYFRLLYGHWGKVTDRMNPPNLQKICREKEKSMLSAWNHFWMCIKDFKLFTHSIIILARQIIMMDSVLRGGEK